MATKFLPFLEVANVLGSAVLYARNVSEGPTAILSSGRVSCSSSSSDILTFLIPYVLVFVKLMSPRE